MSLNMNDISDLTITEGDVRTIHDSSDRLLWGKLNYNTYYAGDTTQQSYSGKNLFKIPDTETKADVTLTKNADGTFNLHGIASAGANFNIKVNGGLESGTYTLSKSEGNFIVVVQDYSGTSWLSQLVTLNYNADSISTSITPEGNVTSFIIQIRIGVNYDLDNVKIQLEKGSDVTTFEPFVGGIPAPNPDYPQTVNVVTGEQTITINGEDFTLNLGTTELCKIGNYQDYIYKSGDDWYVHKEAAKVVLDGSNDETWGVSNTGTANYFYRYQYLSDALTPAAGYSNIALQTGISSSNTNQGFEYIASGELRIRYGTEKSVSDWKTQLSTTNMILYYPLATPTDTQITDTTLISQLNDINEWLTRYGYNYIVSGNLPLIIIQNNL